LEPGDHRNRAVRHRFTRRDGDSLELGEVENDVEIGIDLVVQGVCIEPSAEEGIVSGASPQFAFLAAAAGDDAGERDAAMPQLAERWGETGGALRHALDAPDVPEPQHV